MNFNHSLVQLNAALIGALSTLPQAVAYGLIAFAPLGIEWASLGILSSIASAIVFGFLSASFAPNPYLISGPRAVTALVLAVALETALARGYSPEQALVLGFSGVILAGALQFFAGLFRLGHLASIIPIPVLAGFTTASAIMVCLSALPSILGLDSFHLSKLLTGHWQDINTWSLLIGLVTIITILLSNERVKAIPSALVGLFIGSGLYYLGISQFTMEPGPLLGEINLLALLQMEQLIIPSQYFNLLIIEFDIPLLAGLSIALLASFDTVLTSSALESEVDVHGDANRELKLHGILNLLMGFSGLLPGSGAHSRSSAVIQAGGQGRFANMFSALLFLALLLLLSPWVAAMPLWASSGMLFAIGLLAIDKESLNKLSQLFKPQLAYRRVLLDDVLVTCMVVLTALIFDLISAVGMGMAIAIALFIVSMGRNPIRRYYTASHYHSRVRRPNEQVQYLAQQGHKIAIIELQGALFFGSYAKLLERAKQSLNQGVKYLIIDFRHLGSIDSSGSASLKKIYRQFNEQGGQVFFSYLETPIAQAPTKASLNHLKDKAQNSAKRLPNLVWLNLAANKVFSLILPTQIFDDKDHALSAAEEELLKPIKREQKLGLTKLNQHPLFKGLEAEHIKQLLPYVKRERFLAEQVVFEQGSPGDKLYYLLKGRMEVLINIPNSQRKKRLSALTAGTLFGEMGLIDNSPRSATIIAKQKSTCVSVDKLGLQQLQENHPHIAFILMRNMNLVFAQRLRLAGEIISELEQ